MSVAKDQVVATIAREFRTAEQASQAGNDGMVRVCARRAAGLAIGYWVAENQIKGWRSDAMNLLRAVEQDESMPATIREAAGRLTARITEQFASPYSTDPLADSRTIIKHFLQ